MYQLTILIKDKVDEKSRQGLIDDVKKSFSGLVKEDLWGVRSLAYPIKHADKAFYAYFEFEAQPEAIITLDKNIRLNEDIIRYLIVKTQIRNKKTRAKVVKEVKAEAKETEISKLAASAVKKEEVEIEEKKVRNKKV